MNPWHDSPLCAECDGPMVSTALNPDVRVPRGHRLRCAACGYSEVGSDINHDKALQADAWWEIQSNAKEAGKGEL